MKTKTEAKVENESKRPANNSPYIIAVVIMLVAAMGIVAFILTERPDIDILVAVASVTGIVMPTTLSLLSYMKAQETHLVVNSRMSEFMASLEKTSLAREESALAKGKEEGRIVANERTDALASQTKEGVVK